MKTKPAAFFREISPAWRTRLGLTVLLALVLGSAVNWGPLKSLEWGAEKLRLVLRAHVHQPDPTGQVVLLAVDVKSINALGQWPFPREQHGELMRGMGEFPETIPAVLAWDIMFTEEAHEPWRDQALAAPLAKKVFPVIMGAQSDKLASDLKVSVHGLAKVVPEFLAPPLAKATGALANLNDQRGGVLPLQRMLELSTFAFLDADPDEDGVVRRLPLVVRIKDNVYPSLVLKTLMVYLKLKPSQVEIIPGEAIVLRPLNAPARRIPIDDQGNYTLNYFYELKASDFKKFIPEVSYSDLNEALARRSVGDTAAELPDISGKIVILGQSALGLSDIGPSPIEGQSPKVMVHINALENILRGQYLRHTSVWPGLILLLALGVGAAWVLEKNRGLYVVLVPVLMVFSAGVTWGFLMFGNVMVPLAVPLLAFVAQQAFVTTLKIREEQAHRDRIRKMFGSYAPPEVVKRLVELKSDLQLGGHESDITPLFSDIQGFSQFSEVLSPSDLGLLLNEYLGAMTDVIYRNNGLLDKYIGDAVVAMFGGLLPLPDHARRACESAALMQQQQAKLRAKWQSEGTRWPKLVHDMRTRIGLNSGLAVVGDMGSRHRLAYTMMGDNVNLAARCESGAKTFGVYTLVTGATVASAKAHGCTCVFRALDKIVVKGRSKPVEIFELVALTEADLPAGARECLEQFETGRQHYVKQEWELAIACFTEAAKNEPLQPERDAGVEANPSRLMIERCHALQAKPPGENWDGVYKMTTK